MPAYTLFVPITIAIERSTARICLLARSSALSYAGGDTLYYLWPIEESERNSTRAHAELLCREARYLMALGWGIDQVVGNGQILSEQEAASLPGHRWRPWDCHVPDRRRYRIPSKGSLDDLENVHQSFLRRVDGNPYHRRASSRV